MTDIQKPDMTKLWANAGDKTPPADARINSGWNSGDIPANTDFNFIDARQDQGVAYMLQKGIPEWDSATEYQENKSWVQYDGKIYKSTQTGVNKQPNIETSYWQNKEIMWENQVSADNLGAGKVIRLVACVLRNEGTGWYAIDDTGHTPVGLSSLSIVGDALNLNYSFTGSRVISLIAVPDERVSSWGVKCGTSVGQNSAQIYFYGPLSGAVTNTGIQFNTVLGHDVTQTVDAANGTISVTHAAISHTAGNGSGVAVSDAALFGKLQTSCTKFGFDIKYTKQMDFSFSWPAGVLSVTSNCVGVTAVWDGTGNYIQVTHPNTGGVQQVTAQETNVMGAIHARVSNVTATGFRIYFYNTAGTQITTPSSSLVPYCSREVFMPSPIPAGSVGFYNRENIQMNAANFNTGANGNIWVIGMIEADA